MKKMSIKEFRALGYLQELNRTFLHPLGIALGVQVNEETGEETLEGILDRRDDDEGFYYDLDNSDQERIQRFRLKASHIQAEAQREVRYARIVSGGSWSPSRRV